MKNITLATLSIALLIFLSVTAFSGCGDDADQIIEGTAKSQVKQVVVNVPTNADGKTIEQVNIARRLIADNTPGSIKHFYVISAFSGDVLLYSTVQGKVTSSSKRLTPTHLTGGSGGWRGNEVDNFNYRGESWVTNEMMQDDGSYGSSIPYLYWWDAQGRYHQHYPAGGQIIHISDQPIRVDKVVLTLSVEGVSENNHSKRE